ncbi:MAG: prepilin-type N-terminal cleavage/methylation domain-containing protein [Phycisphaerae bacterium]|nr:prepilin-type N-terminal cleavage/methylation domain-containing protein [Phycisphaerae bacterium]
MILKSKTTKNPKAFTLIELLVVIAIISLLVSILVPSLRKAKDLARTAVCLTTVRTIGVLGLQLYAQDHDGHIPPDYMEHPWPWEDLATPWPVSLGLYVGLPAGFTSDMGDPTKVPGGGLECPEAAPLIEKIDSADQPRCQGGYGINVLLDRILYSDNAGLLAATWNSPWDRNHLPSPTLEQLDGDVVFLGDANLFLPPKFPPPYDWKCVSVLAGRDQTPSENYFHSPDYRHNDQNAANFAYIGGHVQTVNYEDRYDEIRLYPK